MTRTWPLRPSGRGDREAHDVLPQQFANGAAVGFEQTRSIGILLVELTVIGPMIWPITGVSAWN